MNTRERGKAMREEFVRLLLADPKQRSMKAAEGAGYATPHVDGARLMKRADVQEAIAEAREKRNKRMEVSQDEVITDLRELRDMCMARKSMNKHVVVEGTPMEVEVKEFNPASAARSIELLGKHLGMFTDKVEHSGIVGIQEMIDDVSGTDKGNPMKRVVKKDAG